jgi:hypothetical protein
MHPASSNPIFAANDCLHSDFRERVNISFAVPTAVQWDNIPYSSLNFRRICQYHNPLSMRHVNHYRTLQP